LEEEGTAAERLSKEDEMGGCLAGSFPDVELAPASCLALRC